MYTKQDKVYTDDLKVLIDALSSVGSKRRRKMAEWIRGSSSWTENYDKIYLTELTFGGCLQDSHVVGLEVTITDER